MENSQYIVCVNNKKEYRTSFDMVNNIGAINNVQCCWNLEKINERNYHVISNNKSYNVDIVEANYAEKKFVIKINGNQYSLDIKDRFDELLHDLGMDNSNLNKVNDIKAPMPGMVLNIMVNEGQIIKKGDPLLVLEAMKMENVLKSPTDGCIKKVNVLKGDKVEKNTVLVNFG